MTCTHYRLISYNLYVYVVQHTVYSIGSYGNGRCLRAVRKSLQKASHHVVIDCNEDIVQVAPLFTTHRSDTEKISQQHSHFRIIIRRR